MVLMLDEKLQDHEQSLPQEKEHPLSSAKIAELTTAMQNLKWGFRERYNLFLLYIPKFQQFIYINKHREESLSKQLHIHKKAVLHLYAAHKKVRGDLK